MSACVVVILAAGRSRRFPGELPKVLRELNGRPLLEYVVAAARSLEPVRVVIVVGPSGASIESALAESGAVFAVQDEPLGTAHAVLAARRQLPASAEELLVLSGDVPLIQKQTLGRLMDRHRESGAAMTLLTAELDDPTGYGRILRAPDGRVEGIVEHRDATDAQRAVNEINAGIYALKLPLLLEIMDEIGSDNAQSEYYITDAVSLALARGARVEAVRVGHPDEILGVNRPEELERVRKAAAALACRALQSDERRC